MELIEQIKKDLLQARKSKNSLIIDSLTVLVGDAEKIGKDKGNRQPTNDEVLAIVRKTIENVQFTFDKLQEAINADQERLGDLQAEIRWLKQYLPVQLSKDKLFNILANLAANHTFTFDMKNIMAYFKTNYANQYNGKELSEVVKQVLSK